MRTKTQDPKFDIENGKLINARSAKPIPDDEPVFIFRAKDVHAMQALADYAHRCKSAEHTQVVLDRMAAFKDFSQSHPERMKEPDTHANPDN
jgi:hypothetical protein